ncbi:MAG: alpha/beta hydrolase [Clostridia bacterium]|nr:alpha/beta hydrolase [Clostridia bacterium]
MKNYMVDLQKEYGLNGGRLECILADNPWDAGHEDWKRPALVVVPGGGYGMVSKREAEPIAFSFLARGFQVFILRYTIGGENGMSYPEQLIELGAAVDYVKKNAKTLRVNENEVFAIGFSAGGHLTGNLAVEWQSVSAKAGQTLDCKPTAVGLSYPVISKINGHQGSYTNLLYGYSDEACLELLKTLNLNEAVTKDTPPTFLWATATDTVVSADNALRFAQACANNGVPYELHIYPRGRHGLSTASAEICEAHSDLPRVARWVEDCVAFFRMYMEESF